MRYIETEIYYSKVQHPLTISMLTGWCFACVC